MVICGLFSAGAGRFRLSSLTLSLLTSTALAINPVFAQQLPDGASVASGAVSFNRDGATMTVTQGSGRAIVNWNGFSIGQGQRVDFVQPDASSAILNRVTGATPSSIAGTLTANGQVYLINPNGIAITSGGTVKAGGGFVASTLDIDDRDFLDGNLVFRGNGASTGVDNGGVITIGRGGYAALIGGTVRNSGLVAVPLGKAGLGAGEQATLDLSGDGFLQVAVPTRQGAEGNEALIENSGTISADGGTVVMQAATARDAARKAVNLSGVVEAKTVSGKEGEIVIGGGAGGAVSVSGKVRTTASSGKGGKIKVTGQSVRLKGAVVDASGASGGGTVKIGGDWQGKAGTQRAATATVDASSRISADATERGDGGTVVVWSDDLTAFDGMITARGAAGGRGGNAEVSGKAVLSYTGFTDLSADGGSFGTLLLDPYNVTISSGAATNSSGLSATGDDSVISVSTLTAALSMANVAITTGSSGSQAGDILVASDIVWSANTTLTLSAARNIAIHAAIRATGAYGGVALEYGDFASTGSVASGTGYSIGAGGSITLSGASSSFAVNGESYSMIRSVEQLRNLASSGYQALAVDLDASGTVYDGPLVQLKHSGTFAGLGHKLSGFTIDAPDSSSGMFGVFGQNNGMIRDFTIENGTINARGQTGVINAGLVAALNVGTLLNVHATGSVYAQENGEVSSGGKKGGANAGGLVGAVSGGAILNSSASVNVSAVTTGTDTRANAGGLAGSNSASNSASITNSQAGGSVRAEATGRNSSAYAGGLYGYETGTTITENARSTADVTARATQIAMAGGVAGVSSSNSRTSGVHVSGNIGATTTGGVLSSGSYAGGIAGFQEGTIVNSYSTANVTAVHDGTSPAAYAGGMTGYNFGSIDNVWASGRVTGQVAGALVGANNGTVRNSYFDNLTTGRTDSSGAGPSLATASLATADARTSAAYSGWDFSSVWYQAGDMRPILRSEAATAVNGVTTVSGLHQLALAGANLSGNYLLTGDIDASATAATATDAGIWGASGWQPIGRNAAASFTGTFNGGGHTISGLKVNDAATDYGGLFGSSRGTISHTGIRDASITAAYYAGGLVGSNEATGKISASWSGATVSGQQNVGGLVGSNKGNITTSYATGTVNGTGGVGGLVGRNANGVITISYASGPVTGNSEVGGFVGYNNGGKISDSYTTSRVSGVSTVGGFAGGNGNTGTITRVYNAGRVSGSSLVGGMIGVNSSSITSSLYDFPLSGVPNTFGRNVGSFDNIGYLTTSDFLDTSYFLNQARIRGWNTDTVWAPSAGGYYPELFAVSRVITVRPVDASTEYGNALPTLSATVRGGPSVNVFSRQSDTIVPALTTTATSQSAAGSYTITAASGTATSAYGDVYRVISFPGTLQITPRQITVTAGNISRVYGDANPAFGYTLTAGSLVNGDMLSGTLSTAAGLTSNVGSHAITRGSLTASSNYAINYVGGTLSITPRQITVKADNLSRIYGDDDPAFTWSVTSGSLVGSDTLTGSLATSADSASGVGSHAITAGTLAASANYNMTVTGGTLTITPASLTVKAANGSMAYGDTVPGNLGYTVSGWKNGHDSSLLSGVSVSTDALSSSNAGSGYTTTASGGTLSAAVSGNYTLAHATGTFTVAPRAITVKAENASRLYGAANPSLVWNITSGNLVGGDTLTGSLTVAANATSGAGDYAIGQGTLAASSNYALTYTGGILTVNTRAITVTADSLTSIYGNASPPLTWRLTSGSLVGGDTLTGSLATVAGVTSDAGTYAITRGTLAAPSGYTLEYIPGVLTVGQRAITVTAGNLSRTYGDANPELTWQITSGNLVNGDVLSGALATGAHTGSAVGSYDITGGTLSGRNYAIRFVNGALAVTPRAITVAASSASRVYGDDNPSFAYDITSGNLVGGDRLSGSLATSADRTSAAGTHAITRGTLAASPDYSMTFTNGTLTIVPADLTVTARNASMTYGDAAPSGIGYTVSGWKNGHGDGLLSGVAVATGASRTSNVGSDYATSASGGILSGAASGNYKLTYMNGALTVNARPITVSALDVSRVYGDANPSLAWRVTSGNLVGGDSLSGMLATDADIASGAGSYGITQGSLAASANYALTYAGGTLSVTPRAITVTADNVSRIYGDANPSLAWRITSGNLVDGDSLSGILATDADIASGAGSYGITQGSLAASANYALTYAGGTLSVTPRSITVAAADLSRIRGAANPVLGWDIVSGSLVNGDRLSGSLFTAADSASAAGSYAITRGTLAASSSYDLTFVDGLLTVSAAPAISMASITGHAYQGHSWQTPMRKVASGGDGALFEDPMLSGAVCFSGTHFEISCGGN